MDPAGLPPPKEPRSHHEAPHPPDRRSRYLAAGWALALSTLTTIGLFVLTWMLLLMHALGYGVDIVIGAGITSPNGGHPDPAMGTPSQGAGRHPHLDRDRHLQPASHPGDHAEPVSLRRASSVDVASRSRGPRGMEGVPHGE